MTRVRRLVRWRRAAQSDLLEIHDWLATFQDAKPDQAVKRVKAAADSLVRLGDIGRPSRADGLRELLVRKTPYVIVYRVVNYGLRF